MRVPVGVLSLVVVGVWLILFGLAFSTAVTATGIFGPVFLGWAAVVVGSTVIVENVLWPLLAGRNVSN